MASKFLFCISEKVLQNGVERRLFELHSMLQCRDNCRSIEQEMHASTGGNFLVAMNLRILSADAYRCKSTYG